MAGAVKTSRSSYRREQAAATRTRIAEAARRLFAARGYAVTSMQAIAREAGVGDRTVYAVFGSKREILSAICERWLEQADARGVAASALAVADPIDRLRAAAGWLVTLYSTDFDVVRILDAALDEDTETRDLLRSKLRGRNRVMDQLIASVEPELTLPLAEAQAIFRSYAASGVYGELVVESGWTVDRFRRWLSSALVEQLASG